MTASRMALTDACEQLMPVDLERVVAVAGLQTRIDRKYLVPASTFARLVSRLETRMSVLDIAGQRVFAYESVYFDTEDLLAYHEHAHGRRRRFKVRTRSYLDSCETVLEVKTKGGRAETVKDRHPYQLADRDRLCPQARRVVAARLEEAGIADPRHHEPIADRLAKSLVSGYQRATMIDPTTGSRMTCDVDLTFRDGRRTANGPADGVLIESKTAGCAAPVDRLLWRLGHRPLAISKYCAGMAILDPRLPANRWNRSLRRAFGWAPDPRGRSAEDPAGRAADAKSRR